MFPMRVLISNDDGIYSRNLHLLYSALRRAGHDVRAVAPAEQHSGAGCCLTVHDPILTKRVRLTLEGGERFEGTAVSAPRPTASFSRCAASCPIFGPTS